MHLCFIVPIWLTIEYPRCYYVMHLYTIEFFRGITNVFFFNIVHNQKLRDHLRKGPKYREPVSFSWHQNVNIIMDACEEYARRWAKKEDVEVDTLSEWVMSIADLQKRRIARIQCSVNTRYESIFCDPEVAGKISRLHEYFVIVPADKASNNYTFVCKKCYVSILIEELGLNSLPGNPTYNLTDFSASEVMDNHKSVLTSFGLDPKDDELDLTYIYWIPKMHKIPINIDSLPVQQSASPSLYLVFLQSCLHMLSNVFRSTAKKPILYVGWIRCGSSRIQRSYGNILNLWISTI